MAPLSKEEKDLIKDKKDQMITMIKLGMGDYFRDTEIQLVAYWYKLGEIYNRIYSERNPDPTKQYYVRKQCECIIAKTTAMKKGLFTKRGAPKTWGKSYKTIDLWVCDKHRVKPHCYKATHIRSIKWREDGKEV